MTTLPMGRILTEPSKAAIRLWGSLENRVLVRRKFSELGASVAEDIPELEPIETTARALSFEWDEEPVTETPKSDERKEVRP